ncbi:MAG: AAA family ATPase [Planctomycetaceae bacterium]|nr:AAA family ATPase [Planctomycetaceae bacterium]
MRVVITGQVGLDRKPLLHRCVEMARRQGCDLRLLSIGEMMYAEAPDVPRGRILDLPLSRLNGLRRSVFKDVLASCRTSPNVIVNTHATFRWRHGLFPAFDYDQMIALAADVYLIVVDNVDRVHWRLVRDGHSDHTLKDLMVWREEEILATELLCQGAGGGKCYVIARGNDDSMARSLVGLIFNPQMRKAYLSFPMSHVSANPDVLAEIDAFRRQLKPHFVCFDPSDMEEKYLSVLALAAAAEGHRTITVGPPGEQATLDVHQLMDILPDIDGQIYARDFKLIDQSDMIVSLIPALAGGQPGISSGVERELQHAHEAAKDVYVIWRPTAAPSPFITETATKVFPSVAEAMKFFQSAGYLHTGPLGSLFR